MPTDTSRVAVVAAIERAGALPAPTATTESARPGAPTRSRTSPATRFFPRGLDQGRLLLAGELADFGGHPVADAYRAGGLAVEITDNRPVTGRLRAR